MPGPTPHYAPEFKREAIRLYRSSGKSIPKIAEELSIAGESVRWGRREGPESRLAGPLYHFGDKQRPRCMAETPRSGLNYYIRPSSEPRCEAESKERDAC